MMEEIDIGMIMIIKKIEKEMIMIEIGKGEMLVELKLQSYIHHRQQINPVQIKDPVQLQFINNHQVDGKERHLQNM